MITSKPRIHRVALCVVLILIGVGCSRIRKYRAQDSPLPGFPLLGRKDRNTARNTMDLTGRSRPGASDVVWSGQPNNSKALASLEPVQDPVPAREIASEPAKPEETPSDLTKIRELVQTARDRLSKVETYQIAMNRQERVGTNLLPEEDVLLSIRRNPKAVRLEWPNGSHKGREVIYSSSIPGGMMYINMADSVVPIPRVTMAPDSPMVMKNSRHPITEAGLDAILDQLEISIKSQEPGSATGDRLTYDGIVTPPGIGRPCHKVSKVTAKGDVWVIHLDAETGLPASVQETAANGDILEKYLFRKLTIDPPDLAEKTAFDPDGRWGAPRGLFGRFAQGTSGATPAVR